MRFPSLKKPKPEYFLALDIGTETVKALLFSSFLSSKNKEAKQSKKIIIHQASTQYFDEFGVFDTTDFEEEILKKAIFKAIEEIEKETKIKTNSLILGVPANILIGRVLSQSFKRDNPKKIIEEKEKNQIEQAIFDGAKIKLSQTLARTTDFLLQDFHFQHLKILEIKIDGYEVSSLQGLNGKNLEFEVLITFILKNHLEKFQKIFEDFNLRILNLVYEAENLSLIFPERAKDAIFVDIGGKLTKIFLLKKGILKGISEFEGGGVDFTIQLSQTLGVNLQRARVLKHNFSQSILSPPLKERFKKNFSETTQIWFKNFKKHLNQLTEESLPSNIFLFGGGSLLPNLLEVLKKGDWQDSALFAKPKVKIVYPNDLKNIEFKIKEVNTPQQVPPILLFRNFNSEINKEHKPKGRVRMFISYG